MGTRRTNPEFCVVEDCDRRAICKKMCQSHYGRVRRRGTPDAVVRRDLSREERFWTKVDKSGGPDACWPWLDHLTPNGYGSYRTGAATMTPAHRYVHELASGRPIPPGRVIDHMCHDPAACSAGTACPHRACCNPTHLRVSTPGENAASDRQWSAKFRGSCAHGHPYTERNTTWRTKAATGRTYRTCNTCSAHLMKDVDLKARRLAWIAGADNGCAPGRRK